jgi:hypothetical protein
MSEPVTSEKLAIGQSVRDLKDPRLLQALGRYSGDVNGPCQGLVVESLSPMRGPLCAAAVQRTSSKERGRPRGQDAPAGHVHAANR